jgi:cytochrome c553
MLALSCLLIASIAAAAPAKLQVCAACHGEDGEGVGFDYVPIIAGTPAAHLEEALYAYQDGARKCVGVPVMCDAISTLTEAEVAELAGYYSGLSRISSNEPFDVRLARDGELIHAEHCAKCHVSPDSEAVEDALGIPLHGQRAAYLRLALGAYMTGDRETLVPAMAEKIALLDPGKIEALVNYYASYKQ